MQIKLLFRLVLAFMPISALAQSTYIQTGSSLYPIIDRMEIKTRQGILNQSFTRPFSRKTIFTAVDSILNDTVQQSRLTNIDRYNLDKFRKDPEWKFHINNASAERSTPARGFISLTPVARLQYGRESGNDDHPYIASSGLQLNGIIPKAVGFHIYAVANTERLPAYLNNWRSRYNAVPGIGEFHSASKGRVSYLDIRGSVQTSVTRFIDLQLGYDRLFLGNGHRSLFLADQSTSLGFVRINARIWKLNFQSLYIKLTPQDGIVLKKDSKKFLRLNTLGIDVTKWLNISVFDAVVMGRDNGFDLNYVLPLTFLRAMEQQAGSPDNALFGMNIKANLAGKFQLYAQGILDEFKLTEIKAGNGWWANKFGYQLGAKYIDAFGIRHLDLQLETNRVRPFTYTHFDSVSNYTHSNQPLAHPLGANFHEAIGIVRYQPLKKLHFMAKLVYYQQGLDSLGANTGNNILTSYRNISRTYSWKVGSGDKATCLYFHGMVAYELYNDLFIDASVTRRNFKTTLLGESNTTLVSVGLRWNINRREFDY